MEKTRLLWPSIRFSGSRRTDQVHIRARWLTADSHRGQIVSRRAGRNDGASHWSNREAVWRGNFLEAVGQARTGSMSLALASPPHHPSTVSSKHGSKFVHCYLVLREDPQVPIWQHTMPALRAASWPFCIFHVHHLSPDLACITSPHRPLPDTTTRVADRNRAST